MIIKQVHGYHYICSVNAPFLLGTRNDSVKSCLLLAGYVVERIHTPVVKYPHYLTHIVFMIKTNAPRKFIVKNLQLRNGECDNASFVWHKFIEDLV